MFNKFMKTTAFMVLPLAALLALTGCDDDETPTPTSAQVDISETEDLFSKPVQPNPLTTDPTVVVARVNGEDITRGEIMNGTRVIIQQELQRFYMQAAQSGTQVSQQQMQQIQMQLQNNPQVAEEAKNMVIGQKLLGAAIDAANIEIPEEDVTAAIEQDRANVPEGQDFEAALEAQGMTMEQYTARIKEQLAANKFIAMITDAVAEVTEAEAKEFYDENQESFKKPEMATASHILIKFDATVTNETEIAEMKVQKKAEIDKIRADILADTISFADAATQHSEDPGSAANGGEYKNIQQGQMVPAFNDATFSQEIGEIGDAVETRYGYHIIKVTERTEAGTVSFEEAKEQILGMLTNKKQQDAVTAFIKGMRDSATIEMVTAP